VDGRFELGWRNVKQNGAQRGRRAGARKKKRVLVWRYGRLGDSK